MQNNLDIIYKVSAGKGVPEIIFNPANGLLSFSGNSIPENAESFYQPLIEKLNIYKENPAQNTQVHVQFNYYNTSTDRQLVKIFLILEEISQKHSVLINWHHDTDDINMIADGQKFQELIDLDIKLVENTPPKDIDK